jgi:hypothetical protein
MIKAIKIGILAGAFMLLNASAHAQQAQNQPLPTNTEQVLIDKLTCPAGAKEELMKRMKMSIDFIGKQPGLVKEGAYENIDANGNLTVITVVVWKDNEALQKARQAVMAQYKSEGFNMVEFCQKLGVKIDRGIYMPMPQ